MNSEERFKKSLEDLLASKEFSFDQENWEKAREIIDASKKQRRRLAPILFFSGLFLLGSLVTGLYFLADTSSTTDQKLSQTNILLSLPTQSQALTLKSEEPIAAPKSEAPQNIPATPSVNTPKVPETPISKIKEPETTPEPETLIQTKAPVVKQNNPVVVPGKVETFSSPNSNPEKETKQNPAETKQAIITNPIATLPVAAEPTKSASAPEKEADKEITTPAVASENTDLATAKNSPGESKKSSEQDLAVSPKEKEAPVEMNIAAMNADNEPAKKTEEPADAVLTIQPPATAPDSTKSNSTVAIPGDNADGELGKSKEYPILFSIEAGANYMFGWQNPGNRDANGFDPVVGINYFNNFKSKMALTVGLQYTSVSHLNFSNYTSRVTRLALGEESKVTIFTPTKVQYLIMPIRFDYAISPKNSVGIGCNLAYLLNVRSDVETYTEKGGTQYNESHTMANGYTKGFKTYDTQMALFYKRRLHPNFALNLEFYYGLTDVKDNTFFKSNVTERNTGLKLTLVYNFLKK